MSGHRGVNKRSVAVAKLVPELGGQEVKPHVAEVGPLVGAGHDETLFVQLLVGNETVGAVVLGCLQRVIQQAILHVQTTAKKEVTAPDVLVAIFGEKQSHAVYFLEQQGITRLKVVTHIAHGVALDASAAPVRSGDASIDVQIVLYDDDDTPMDFLARVLQDFFAMNKEDAAETLLEIYRTGKAVCGLYSPENGEAIVREVVGYARKAGHPLRCEAIVPKTLNP